MIEEWKEIQNFPDYKINKLGEIIGKRKSTPIKLQQVYNKKYYRAYLKKKGKLYRVPIHRLVYATFVGEIPIGYEIDHIDENPTNNCLNNLRIVTKVENQFNRTKTKRDLPIRVFWSGYSYGYNFTVNGITRTKRGFATPEQAHIMCEQYRKEIAKQLGLTTVDN